MCRSSFRAEAYLTRPPCVKGAGRRQADWGIGSLGSTCFPEAAYRAAYFDQLMEASTARTAQQVEQGVAARIQQRAQRPAENGAHPGGAAEMKVDVAHMTAKQRAELAKRARRGERIVL